MKSKKIIAEHIREKICPVCNKPFIPAPLHIYKIKYSRLVCSYKCRCDFERREQKAKEARGQQ